MTKNDWEHIFSISSSAILADVFAYPIHTIWTVQQENSEKQRLSFLKAYQNIAVNGHRQFYKGFSLSVFSAVPVNYFYLFGAKCAITCFGDNHFGQIMQGIFAQICSTLISAPVNRFIELEQSATTDAANNAFKRLSVFDKSKKIWNDSGVRGMYRGALPMFLIAASSDGLAFWFRWRMLKRFFSEEQSHQFVPQLFSTAVGFSAAYAFFTPLYAVETRLRLHENNPAVFKDTTFFATMRTLHRQRGYRGFCVGASANALYGVITALPVASNGCFN